MLHQTVLNQWNRCKGKISELRSKSIDRFKDKEIRYISQVELEPNTHGKGKAKWDGEFPSMKGNWNFRSTNSFTQKLTIGFQIEKVSEVLELVENQDEDDRKLLRTKSDRTVVNKNFFTETNLTTYKLISYMSQDGGGPTIEEVD